MNEQRDDRLIAAARELATDIAPERDLWPGIAESIARPRGRSSGLFAQAAAVILLVAASSGVTWYALRDERPVVNEYRPELMFERAAFGGRYSLGPGFQDARGMLIAELDAGLRQLSPEDRADVETSLVVMQGVIAEINAELDKDPENVYLQEMLLRSYHEELALMRRVGGLTRNVMLRNNI